MRLQLLWFKLRWWWHLRQHKVANHASMANAIMTLDSKLLEHYTPGLGRQIHFKAVHPGVVHLIYALQDAAQSVNTGVPPNRNTLKSRTQPDALRDVSLDEYCSSIENYPLTPIEVLGGLEQHALRLHLELNALEDKDASEYYRLQLTHVIEETHAFIGALVEVTLHATKRPAKKNPRLKD